MALDMIYTVKDARRVLGCLVVDDEGCWEWPKGRNADGYGKVKIQGRTVGAHRVVYELLVGPIPRGLHIDHLCRNPACVRPDHLEPVTCGENLRRGNTVNAACAAKTHCPQGHAYDEANTRHYRGERFCRACSRDRDTRRRALRKNPVQLRWPWS